MKKLIFIAMTMLSVLSSCIEQEPKENLRTQLDTLSYSIGMVYTYQLDRFFKENKIDTAIYMEDFIRGLIDGFDCADKKKEAYIAGLQVSQNLTHQSIPSVNKIVFENDTAKTISKENFIAGFVAGALRKTNIMTWDRANVYSDSVTRAIRAMRGTADDGRYVDREDGASMQTRPVTQRSSRYYYLCKHCRMLVKSPQMPNGSGCRASTFHSWSKICPVGTEHAYSCKRCGIQVETNEMPPGGNFSCLNNQAHYWTKLY